MILPILKLPTPSLREKSTEVDLETLKQTTIQSFIDDMIPTMYDDDGIGLAAPQVAKNIRIVVIGKAADDSLKDDIVLVNPEWTRVSKKTNSDVEGCLSVKNMVGKVKRYSDIHVRALDRHGKKLEFDAHKYFARVIQHEVDHLNGVLFIDRAYDLWEVENDHIL